jgi:hypothetical protein
MAIIGIDPGAFQFFSRSPDGECPIIIPGAKQIGAGSRVSKSCVVLIADVPTVDDA